VTFGGLPTDAYIAEAAVRLLSIRAAQYGFDAAGVEVSGTVIAITRGPA
jgi:hypothetical protein